MHCIPFGNSSKECFFMDKKKRTARLTLTALFAALTVVMTVTPYFGYITYGGVIEITTIHIAVILGAAVLGKKNGALIGGIWGVTCLLRALTNTALYGLFLNPLISVVPRIAVGFVAGLLSEKLLKTKLPKALALSITAAVSTLTNTVLVLGAIYLFGGTMNLYADIFELVKSVFMTIIGINGIIELLGAVILVPAIYIPTQKYFKNKT